jgi:hypothetical protein
VETNSKRRPSEPPASQRHRVIASEAKQSIFPRVSDKGGLLRFPRHIEIVLFPRIYKTFDLLNTASVLFDPPKYDKQILRYR